jgi:hypothetical protein
MTISSKLNQVVLVSVLFVIIVVGCVAAIPIAVHYSSDDDKHVATAEVGKDSDELWLAVVRAAEKREGESEGEMKILKKDSTARRLEATDGIQTASVEVIPVGEQKSKVIITADTPEDKGKEIEKDKELAALIMKALCEEAKANCELVEK